MAAAVIAADDCQYRHAGSAVAGYLSAAWSPYGANLPRMTMTPPMPPLVPAEFTEAEDHLTVSRPEPGLVVVTLANPDMRNAMSAKMTQAFARLVPLLIGDDELRAVVLVGAGRAFCSGGDTSWIGSEPHKSVDEVRSRMIPFYRTWLAVRDIPVPVIVGVNGAAIGAGACFALGADVRIGAQSAKFGVPFLKLGMHPGMATTYLLPEVVGLAAARDLLYTGRIIDSARMLELGVVTEVLPDEGFTEAVIAIGSQVAQNAPIATKLTKVALRDGGPATLDACVEWEALAQPITLATEDLQEGLVAAREKRPPRFVGK